MRLHPPFFRSPARRLALLGAGLAAVSGCGRADRTATYAVVVRVEGEPGRPLRGAAVSVLGKRAGTTGDSGTLTLALRGLEGEHVPFTVVCPEGFQSPAQPTDVVLHRLAEPARTPEYDATCTPARWHLVVVVRADHGAGLPVLYLGREVARTDASGAAHTLIEAPASEDIELTLSTDGSESRLRPQNPSMKFAASDPSEIKIFSVQFEVEPEKRRAAAAPHVSRPIRLN